MERGHLEALSLRAIRRAFSAVDGRFEGLVLWRGGALDRLLDERHAALAGAFAGELRRLGWKVEFEVTYSRYGERGSIDVLAWFSGTATLLVVEIKTEIASVEETMRRLDVKVRLAASIAKDRFGWQPASIARFLVVARGATNYRRIHRHEAVFQSAFPIRGWAARQWLRQPTGRVSGLLVVSPTNPRGS
jgi:hypothetical protein